MSMHDLNPAPIKFVDSLDTRKHIALFYDDAEYARLIEFRFIKNGLSKGEQCIYATEDDSGSIVLKMLSYGIPLEYFQRKQLRVYQIHNDRVDYDEIMQSGKKEIGKMLSELHPPFRIVSRIIPDVSTITGMSAELELERNTHHCFDDLGGILMCPYDLSKIETSRRDEWLTKLGESHHDVIYAPKFGEGRILSVPEISLKSKLD